MNYWKATIAMSLLLLSIIAAAFFSIPAEASTLPDVKIATIPSLIDRYGYGSGLKASEVAKLKQIAWCESNYQANATNGQYRGIFQIGYREFDNYGDGSPLDPQENIKAAIRYYKVSGFRPWSCK